MDKQLLLLPAVSDKKKFCNIDTRMKRELEEASIQQVSISWSVFPRQLFSAESKICDKGMFPYMSHSMHLLAWPSHFESLKGDHYRTHAQKSNTWDLVYILAAKPVVL